MNLQQLNQRFAIDGLARFEEGHGGLTRLRLTVGQAEGEVYLHGAHVTHWAPAPGRPVLWMSGASLFEAGSPIRGGVPVCWPWFGAAPGRGDLPAHGFVRRMDWEVESVARQDEDRAAVVMTLGDTDQTRAQYPHPFQCRMTIVLGPELTVCLEAANTGDAPMAFTEAFHPYFAVTDIREASVCGLEGLPYVDLRDRSRHVADDAPLRFAGETDREYFDSQAAIALRPAAHWQTLLITKAGSMSTVIWNPWTDKARRMSDFGDDEWPGMLCIEPANAATQNAVTVAPGQRHAMTMTVTCADPR